MMAAIAVPVVLVMVCGAIDLSSVAADRSKVQDAADAAALAAAKQLGVSDATGVKARAEAFVRDHLTGLDGRLSYSVAAVPARDLSSITVSVEGRRTSFFANMLPPGGWPVSVSATASPVGRLPLCVLASGADPLLAIEMHDAAQVTAGGCAVHANGDIAVDNTAWLKAAMVQSAGRASGRISPTPQESAPLVEDPFSAMKISTLFKVCVPVDVVLSAGINLLPPGMHCGRYRAPKGATLRLMPGEHYFKGALELTDNSTLLGEDVVLIFDETSQFQFKDSSNVMLTGRRAGVYAGFVLVTTRANTGEFLISSDSARQMLGTIYIPNATLAVTGLGNRIADQSAWTVVIAKTIRMSGSPNLVINSNYAGSAVPVPKGVGANSEVILSR